MKREPGRHLELVVSGLLRIYLMAPDGRTLTIRYCRTGSVMGAVSLFSVDYVMPGFIQALVAIAAAGVARRTSSRSWPASRVPWGRR